MKLYKILEEQLKKEINYVTDDGEVKKWVVLNKAQSFDEELIGLLLGCAELKEAFFVSVKGVLVFNQNLFVQFLEQKNYFNDSYTLYKNKIGLTIDGKYLRQHKEVALVWPFKDCVLEGGQSREEDKREEIFFNEILAQDEITQLFEAKVLTNAKRIGVKGKKKFDAFRRGEDGGIKDNLIIKGNNLLALHSLNYEFSEKIKMIYIDPPYYFNRKREEDSFKYNSNFSFSTWLVFMKNRLDIAKRLLTKGGTIWISISEDGMHYLKVLADSIFGKDRFVGTIPRRTRNAKSDVPFNLSQDFDWLLCYTNLDDSHKPIGRIIERKYYETDDFPGKPWRLADATSQRTAKERPNSYFTMINPKNGDEYPADEKRTWGVTSDTFNSYYQNGAIVFPGDYDFLKIGKPYMRKFKSEDDAASKLSAVISDFQMRDFLGALLEDAKNKDGNSEVNNLFGRGEFGYAKPENLIKAIIEVATQEGDIVLDYHLGSGTSVAIAHKMNRQYIGVEQMDYIETLAVERLKKVIAGENGGISNAVNWKGGGDFVYLELKKYNHAFIRQIEDAIDTKALLEIWEYMKDKSFLNYNIDIKRQEEHIEDFKKLSLKDQRRHLCGLLDKNQLYVNLSSLNDADFECSEDEKRATNDFYQMKAEG